MSCNYLINVNIHRAKEGARVLEDIARFLLHDEILFQEIREIRHSIQISAPTSLITQDVGGQNFFENNIRSNIFDTIQANASRLQEALRVLEEMILTLPEKQRIKNLRYRSYDFHAKIYLAAKKYLKLSLLNGLYLIIDTDVISYPLEEIIEIINQSSINIVQYRNKSKSKKDFFKCTYKIKKSLDTNKLFIINDHIDIALDLADGVHVGQDDYPLERIRNIIPAHFIVGISCHNSEEARMAAQLDISYIALGCLFETKSKNNVIPVSINELQKICHETSLPVCGIGGINIHNLEQVLTADIKMAALISYVWKTENPLETINDMHKKIISFRSHKEYCASLI